MLDRTSGTLRPMALRKPRPTMDRPDMLHRLVIQRLTKPSHPSLMAMQTVEALTKSTPRALVRLPVCTPAG
jgi:hypothetical protein